MSASTSNMTSLQPVDFATEYVSLRTSEGRMYSDEEVSRLPLVSDTHQYAAEWKIRKASCEKLMNYIKAKQECLSILEVGCGNGWLSNQLSLIKDCQVTGLDVNLPELEQAKRVFKGANLSFVFGDLSANALQGRRFDVIVFAASFQYFPSVSAILNKAFEHLSPSGEVHIIDSYFYSDAKRISASKRSKDYFSSVGHPEMKRYYFHHSMRDLAAYNYRILNQSSLWIQRVLRKRKVFPWICIKPKNKC